ncbi:MAG TPA: PorV/PorQ family protein [Rhodothermales bacterium]|nr:PorV/PorQ family protein [Rhodothermales bacterium]
MKRNSTIILKGLLLAAVMVGGSRPAAAQTKTGTTVGQFLLVEPSARASGMGNAAVAVYGQAESAFYNPGAVGQMQGSGVQFTYSSWLAGITYNYAVAALRLGGANTLIISTTALNSGNIDVRTVDRPEGTGEQYTVSDLAFGIGYARRLTDRFSAGLQAKYVQERIWHSSLTALALDFGVLYRLPFGSYLGASLSNFGSRGRYDGRDLRVRYDQDPDRNGDNSSLPAALVTKSYALPIIFRVGLGVPVRVNDYSRGLLVVDAAQPSDNTQSLSLGTEWTFFDVFSIRGGYQQLFQKDSELGLTLGSGINYNITSTFGVQLDYAWANHQSLGDIHRFTLGVTF